MIAWLWLWAPGAWAWTAAEVRVGPGAAPSSAVAAGRLDGGPGIVLLGPQGLAVIDLGGEVRATSGSATGVDVVVRDLDDRGADEILLCGPRGIELVRGDLEGIYGAVPLATAPCEALAAFDAGSFAALISVDGGRITRWTPTVAGLEPTELALRPAGPLRPVSLGTDVAVAGPDGVLLRVSGDEVRELDLGAPILDLAAAGDELALALGGDEPVLRIGEASWPLPSSEIGLVAGGEQGPPVWVVDRAGAAVGFPDGDALQLTPVPVTPVLAVVVDEGEDGCPDLALFDAQGSSALVIGRCAEPVEDEVVAAVDWPPVLSEPPAEYALRARWGTLDVQVGQALDLRLIDGQGRAVGFRSRGGPPGFAVQADGRITWVPEPDDVGQWRVSVRLSEGLAGRWNGFLLRVFPAAGRSSGSAAPEVVEAEGASDQRRRSVSALAPRRCAVALGLAGGAASAGAVTWENLGGPDVRGGASPLAAFTCAGGSDGPVQWLVGADTAPFFSFASSPEDRFHALAFVAGVQFGPERLHAGPYATAGFDLLGLGARFEWLGLRDWRDHPMGLEGRLLWLAPQIGAEVALAWVWSL